MKFIPSRIILFILTIIVVLFVVAGVATYQYLWEQTLPSTLKNYFLVSFITAFIIVLLVDIVVLKKVSEVLNMVKNYRTYNNKKQTSEISDPNEIVALKAEIMAWADERKNEIDRLQKLEVYRKEFLGNVSHELKTPIFNIQGYISTLLDGGLDDKNVNKNYLARAEKSIDRMIHIIEDLESISQLETGELTIEPERFDIGILAKEVADAEEIRATAKGIMINLPKDTVPVFVYADRFRIRQVLINLVVNSIKYGKEYGETKIRFHDMGLVISVEVTDNGIGITGEHLPRLFERFYRVDKSRSREQGGTGLGLSIVKHIMEAHNQVINVTSKEDVGTTFTFTLIKA
jgi:two-component system, OmpR family, phosphate regulon sensor histidine kinase PhoR